MVASDGEDVTHSGRLGREIGTVVGALADDDGDSVNNVDAVVEQLLSFVGVVGHQLDVGDAHRIQHLSSEIVPSGIGRQAEGEVGVQRVVPFVLEGIGLHFGVEADAPSFLAEINNGAVTGFLNGLHGGFKLRSAVASLRTEGVAGKALGVNPNQRGALGEITDKKNAVFLAGGRISKSTDAEFTEIGGEKGFRLRLE